MGAYSTFLQFIFPHYKTKSEGKYSQKRACFLVRVDWKEPENAGGLFHWCFELLTIASNTSTVCFDYIIDSRVQNHHKKSQ